MFINTKLDRLDQKITQIMKKIGVPVLRYSLGILFIWFGLLKALNLSPAQDLVAKTVYWFSPSWFVPFLGWWEVVIGLCLVHKALIRLGILLLAVQMAGTFLPFVLLPEVVFGTKFYALTLEGQYIIKNIIIIAAAIVIGSHVRDKK
ncbi:MAG: hypothetical protein Q8R37_06085 [Nanoarchaeota archaeon]|nr:hypothetical protein [Nanoarchaeota archaeon]